MVKVADGSTVIDFNQEQRVIGENVQHADRIE